MIDPTKQPASCDVSGPAAISRRTVLMSLGATAVGSLAGCSRTRSSRSGSFRTSGPQSKGPNVLYVTADDLGVQLHCYGHPVVQSPRIDQFASTATQFDRCYCQAPMCGPSRVSILTGLRPEHTKVMENDQDWRDGVPDAKSLPRLFRDAGYHTVGVGKIADVRNGPLDDAWTLEPDKLGLESSAPAIAALGELARRTDPAPFFFAVGFKAPHCPWEPTATSKSLYPPDSITPEGPGRTVYDEKTAECWGVHAPRFTDAQDKDMTARFYATVSDLDRMFGEVYDEAVRLGLLKNTIVIFWSGDHGFSLGKNGRWGKWTNYDAVTRIPLLFRLPGQTKGQRCDRLVEAVDMYPTLQGLCGLARPPQKLDGLSFKPLLADPSQPWKKAAFSVWWRGERSIKTEEYNLMEWPERRPSSRYELYDLATDPDETTNLAATRPEVVMDLVSRLKAGPEAALP